MEGSGLGWAGWIGVAGGIAGVLSVIVALLAWLGPSRREVADDLASDATYRADIAGDLRDRSLGQRYRNGLEAGLALLDRQFGAASSAKALGRCIIIALVYAYAGFVVVWGFGSPGVVGGREFLPQDAQQPARLLVGALLAIAPLVAYGLGRALGPRICRSERRVVTRLHMIRLLRRRWRMKRSAVDRLYRFGSALVLLLAVVLSSPLFLKVGIDGVIASHLFGSLPILGVATAVHLRPRFRTDWTGALGSTAAGAAIVVAGAAFGLALAVAVAFSFSVAAAAAFSFSVAAAAAVAFAIGTAGALAVAVVVVATYAATAAYAVAGAIAGSFAVAAAVAVGLFPKPGAFPGAVGAMVGLASFGAIGEGGFIGALALSLLIFFLVLPLINGWVDWGSWWVTRRLGAHLLRALDRGAGAVRLGVVALGHGVADLVIAAGMLLGMAFMLALGFEGYNQLSLLRGEGAFDLVPYVEGAAAEPFGEGAWLTLMLLTTLVPTFLHVAVVWASPVGLVFVSARRRQWADDLEQWDELDEATRSRTRRAVAFYVAHGRIGLWLVAGLLALGLFALMAGAVALVHQGGFSDYVARAAYLGIDAARWLGGRSIFSIAE